MSTATADRRILLSLASGVLLLIVLTALFAPASSNDDPTPGTYNAGTHGAKAAYLLLGELGYSVSRSEVRADQALDGADAARTTYILAGPRSPGEEVQKAAYDAVERFLNRGGRVLATGFPGAYFLPDGRTGNPTRAMSSLCTPEPEGRAVYAQVGAVTLYESVAWTSPEPLVRVDQRCGADAVVVHRTFPHGGEMVWWSSAEPLSNRGLAQDPNLRLLLASVGPAGGRQVLFDEFYHGEQATASDYLEGLPLRSVALQAGLLFLLLVFSFSRRSGPVREPARIPRTSPVEFARNMGALYQRAGATQPATEAARRRLLHVLSAECGFPAETLARPAAAIAEAVHLRFDMDAQALQEVLDGLEQARYERLRPGEALRLVQSADAEIARLRSAAAPAAGKATRRQEIRQMERTR